ncbi:chromatin structure-remodeling complex subunit SFH1 [Sporothrix schenckii 1099-18]|uniref:GATA-type domain-containing protein n=2 Tax=Sporothrix schenckii TaxID=29908 RepID=U7PI06_SPOS1|nr:chromatin structure-remodeling complex subunit SFH1 [Sporothrix schenckii 1099-18]ERS95228.1 hypothetical protein HMPREF1624_08440 [Sporothrix schenckii ATCC 58251]KJR90027.1 chromatin structure-remodeling complex subunit SFH1 [Sporothrix schenckii 1099-18]
MAGTAPPVPSATSAAPQAYWSSYAARLRAYHNALLVPVNPSAPAAPKTTKRGTTIINYAEDGFDDYLDDDDDDSRRRPSSLRLRGTPTGTPGGPGSGAPGTSTPGEPADRIKDADGPVEVQGVWRDWQGKTRVPRSDLANYAQACLPSTLIPIRIDVEIPPYLPMAPLGPPIGPPPGAHASVLAQYDMTNPLNRQPGEATIPFRLKDTFLWNLHETLITTDQFAITLTQDLDLPVRSTVAAEISKQIRTQLEEYAGVALHPLFHSHASSASKTHAQAPQAPQPTQRDSATPAAGTPHLSLSRADTPSRLGGHSTPAPPPVTAVAEAIEPDADDYNPDDTYRCIVNLNINLASRLYTDKFEWSLLHPPGTAEAFARQTCADLGLAGEWVPAMTHAIYEAVLRLKKEACESGGLVGGGLPSDFPNDAALGHAAGGGGLGGDEDDGSGGVGGWRYDPDTLGDAWEPKVEILSKEDIEKREYDRERQLRRLRRETARFSSNTGMAGGLPAGFGALVEEEERMGRGERTKKKRRFRSLSPLGRGGTPGRATPDVGSGGSGGYGGGGGTLTDSERTSWRCAHCRVWGTSVWAVRDGPHGPRSLCNNCGYLYERDRKLPRWTKMLHVNDVILL